MWNFPHTLFQFRFQKNNNSGINDNSKHMCTGAALLVVPADIVKVENKSRISMVATRER